MDKSVALIVDVTERGMGMKSFEHDGKTVGINEFLRAYAECALWLDLDDSDESGGEPLVANFGFEDIASETWAKMHADCIAFREYAAPLLAEAEVHPAYSQSGGEWSPLQRAGHDYWLTRNGHGTGFWDRGLGELGDKLTEASKLFGSVDLYVGDDGKVYQS